MSKVTITNTSYTVKRDRITDLYGHPLAGLWELVLEHEIVHIASGHGVRQLAAAFDAHEDSGDIHKKIKGQTIIYSTDGLGVLEAFTPIAQWTGKKPRADGGELVIKTKRQEEIPIGFGRKRTFNIRYNQSNGTPLKAIKGWDFYHEVAGIKQHFILDIRDESWQFSEYLSGARVTSSSLDTELATAIDSFKTFIADKVQLQEIIEKYVRDYGQANE
jgi:hypothetical protein